MADYSSLQSSIASAVESYENYKGQSLRLKLDGVSLSGSADDSPTKSHAKRASMAMPSLPRLGSSEGRPKFFGMRLNSSEANVSRAGLDSSNQDHRPSSPSVRSSSTRREYEDFITVAENYETCNFLFDLDFLLVVLDFMRSQHPYTSSSLQKAIKSRQSAKKKLWTQYTSEMQGLARAYTSGKTVPIPPATSPLSPTNGPSARADVKERKAEIEQVSAKLEKSERTCAESVFSALRHLYAQAIKDIHDRYSLADPINDKVTSVQRHNERVRVFNQLIKFVSDDLRRIETAMKSSGQVHNAEKRKDKKGSGVVEAVESLCIEDYPPYGSK